MNAIAPGANAQASVQRVRLGISACVLGEPVRVDGGHKRNPFLVESLGPLVDWVPVCPDVESGLEELADADLCGFVLKKDSPMVRRCPLLPVEEEGRLSDPRLCENFIERVFAYRRLTALFSALWSMGDVVRFHTAHKLTLLAHRPEAYERLGRLVASGKSMARRAFQDRYSTEFMTALATIATPRRHANVLQHMLGYFKQSLDRESRAELLALIEDHADGRVPLAEPLTLFSHHVRRCAVPYLADQVYLRPDRVELMPGNHA